MLFHTFLTLSTKIPSSYYIVFAAHAATRKKQAGVKLGSSIIVIPRTIIEIAGGLCILFLHGATTITAVLGGFAAVRCFGIAVFIQHANIIVRTKTYGMQCAESFVKSGIILYALED